MLDIDGELSVAAAATSMDTDELGEQTQMSTENPQLGEILAERLGIKVTGREGHDLKAPCIACSSSDAFRVHCENGVGHCYSCGNSWSPFAIAKEKLGNAKQAVELMCELRIFEKQHLADRNGRSNADPIEVVARMKNVSAEALKAFGAATAERVTKKGKRMTVVRFPAYGPDGEKRTDFDIPTFGDAKGLWQKGGGTGVFLPAGRCPKPGETWLLTEGVKDAAALFSLGYRNVAGMPKCEMAATFCRLYRGVKVILVPDRDRAGEEGAQKTAARLYHVAESVRIATLPTAYRQSKGEDVRDLLAKPGGAELVRQCIDDAVEWNAPITSAGTDCGAFDNIPSIACDDGRTEMANGRRLRAQHGQDVLWCDTWSKWLVWDGKRWALDRLREVEARAKQVARQLWSELPAMAEFDTKEFNAAVRFCRASASARGIAAMVNLAKSETGIAALPDRFDDSPWMLNVLDGTVDLRTGDLHEHRRDEFLTKLAPVEYLHSYAAECPNWERFLEDVFEGNENLIRFIQRAAGYSLTGVTDERCLFFLYGSGCNGKTTLITALQRLLGDYATTITTELLMVSRGETHPTEICDLAGRRLAVASETEGGRRFAESLVKQMTGGEDKLKGRRMREDFWDFWPSHKLWISGNHKPDVRGTDDGIWDRIRIIPFKRRFENPDKGLPRTLDKEQPGILRWCVRGCLDWQRDGLGEPDEVRHATSQYRGEMDIIGAFVGECCVADPNCRTRARDLLAAYGEWCHNNNERPKSQRQFGEAMTERGFERATSNGTWYLGIGLRREEE